jgi:hypothetical protein
MIPFQARIEGVQVKPSPGTWWPQPLSKSKVRALQQWAVLKSKCSSGGSDRARGGEGARAERAAGKAEKEDEREEGVETLRSSAPSERLVMIRFCESFL